MNENMKIKDFQQNILTDMVIFVTRRKNVGSWAICDADLWKMFCGKITQRKKNQIYMVVRRTVPKLGKYKVLVSFDGVIGSSNL